MAETSKRYLKRCLVVIVSRILTHPVPNSPTAAVLEDIVTPTRKKTIGTVGHISGQIGVFRADYMKILLKAKT